MRIVVCVKQVPDGTSERGYTAQGQVQRTADDAVLNPPDEDAVRAAVDLAAAHDGEVTVLTMGPRHATRALRRGLQLGAHRAVLVTDPALAGSDVFATAAVLAAAVRRVGDASPVDLVLTGAASLDASTAVVPVLLAAELGVPHAAGAVAVSVHDGAVRVRLAAGGGVEVRETALPAVVGVGTAEPDDRPVDMAAIRRARTVMVETWTPAELGLEPGAVGPAAARTRVVEVAPRPAPDRVLVVDDGTAGDLLADFLLTNGLVP